MHPQPGLRAGGRRRERPRCARTLHDLARHWPQWLTPYPSVSSAPTSEQCAKVLGPAAAHRSRAARDAAASALGAFMDRDGLRPVLQGIARAGTSLGQGGAALRDLAEAMAAARVASGGEAHAEATPAHEVFTPDGAVSGDGGSAGSATPRSVGSEPSEVQLYPLQGGPVAGRRAARRQASSASLGESSQQVGGEEGRGAAVPGAGEVSKPWSVPARSEDGDAPTPFGLDNGAHSTHSGRSTPQGSEGGEGGFFGRPSLEGDTPAYAPSRAFTGRSRRPSEGSDGSGRAAFGNASAPSQ